MMGTAGMDHGSMDHGSMDHGSMDHGSMDHGSMDHGAMDHSGHSPHMMSGHSGHNMAGMGGMGHDMMKMYFHFTYEGEVVLFEQWVLSSIGVLIGSMIGLFILAVLYEGLKYYREHLLYVAFNRSPDNPMTDGGMHNDSSTTPLQSPAATTNNCHSTVETPCPANEETTIVPNGTQQNSNHPYYYVKPYMTTMFNKVHACQTGLHVVQLIVSYLLMLVFMTYNVWLCLAVALGSGLGYFLFGWRKTVIVDITEHCH